MTFSSLPALCGGDGEGACDVNVRIAPRRTQPDERNETRSASDECGGPPCARRPCAFHGHHGRPLEPAEPVDPVDFRSPTLDPTDSLDLWARGAVDLCAKPMGKLVGARQIGGLTDIGAGSTRNDPTPRPVSSDLPYQPHTQHTRHPVGPTTPNVYAGLPKRLRVWLSPMSRPTLPIQPRPQVIV